MVKESNPGAALPVHKYSSDLELKAGQLAALTAFLVAGELHHMADHVQSSVLGVAADLAREVDALARVVARATAPEAHHG